MSDPTADAYEALMQFLYRAPIGLVELTPDGAIEMLNPISACLLMPLTRDGKLDNLFDVLEGVAPQLRTLVQAFGAAAGVVCDALRLVPPAAERQAVQVLSVSLLKVDATRLMAVINDVTREAEREQQGLDRRLRNAERTDTLTRMPNRAAARDQVTQALARCRDGEFALLFINCDRFKQVNDSLGQAVGDAVLGLVADRLRATLRQRERTAGEPMAARVGGDEFVLVLDDLRHPDDVHTIAQRLLDVLSKPYGIGAHQWHGSVSMGVVLQAQVSGDADAVLQDGSIAMIEAKRAGGARYVVFGPGMRERSAKRSSIEADLRRALDEHELRVFYQPVVDLQADGGLAGVEALVRWRHPSRGWVMPGDFIEAAEESGLIGALGDFVLATACRQFVAWQRQLGAQAPRTLAVNLSRAQLTQPGLVASVSATLQASAMAPAQLQLEVTESLAAQDEPVQARLRELKELGLTLALDDFGTGYSSLACLHLLPVDTVKIDRSFVSQSATSRHHRVLIEATIRVAESLGMGTVAEGIETEAQAAALRELGCHKGQGYLFARPLPADELAAWAAARPAR